MARVRTATACAAAGLALASAAVSLYWTLGGDALLSTVGGAIETLARDRSPGAVALGMVTVLLKVAAGALALALLRLPETGFGRRALLVANGIASAILCAWGGANVLVGGLVLSGAITPSTHVDRHALRWHVFVWDMWFLIWGICLAIAITLARSPGRVVPESQRVAGGVAEGGHPEQPL